MKFHTSAICITVSRLPHVLFKAMLRGSIRTMGQIFAYYFDSVLNTAETSLEDGKFWDKLVYLITSSCFYVGERHAAGIHLCSPVMTLVWFGTPGWL